MHICKSNANNFYFNKIVYKTFANIIFIIIYNCAGHETASNKKRSNRRKLVAVDLLHFLPQI